MKLTRHTTADMINEVMNDPYVKPWLVPTDKVGAIDMTNVVRDPRHVLLMGEYGGVLFANMLPGVYEAHTNVLPAGRGRWTLDMVNEALFEMFTRHDAMEIVTRVPYGNMPARALVKAIHGVFEFRREGGWAKDGKVIPADYYALRVQDWVRTAPGLEKRGEWFHHRLEEEYKNLGRDGISHGEDANHDRYVGAAVSMILGGQPYKGLLIYNRWALQCNFVPAQLVSESPLTIDIGEAILVVEDNNFWVMSCRELQS